MANKRGQGEGSISKRPNGTWWARVTIGKDENGKQVRQAFYGKTRKEVQTKMTAAINDINKGTYIEPSKLPYSQWLDIWMKEYKKKAVRKQTYCVYAQLIRLHINPAIGNYQLKNLRPDVLQRLVNDMADKGLARSTIQKVKNVIKGSIDQAVKNDMLSKNPADSVVLPNIESKDKVILTPDEQVLYIQTAKNYLYGKALVFILGTGLRMGEALALTWDDIDFTNRTVNINKNQIKVKDPDVPGDKWHLEVNPPKTKAGYRVVPLLPAMIQLLQEIRQEQQTQKAKAGADYMDNNLVFCCARGQRIEFGNIRWSNIHIRELAGIESKVSVHGLRHSFATRGLENGIPLKVMQELLGHASIKMTADLYTHVLPETKQAEMMKLEDTIKFEPPIGEEQPDTATQQ